MINKLPEKSPAKFYCIQCIQLRKLSLIQTFPYSNFFLKSLILCSSGISLYSTRVYAPSFWNTSIEKQKCPCPWRFIFPNVSYPSVPSRPKTAESSAPLTSDCLRQASMFFRCALVKWSQTFWWLATANTFSIWPTSGRRGDATRTESEGRRKGEQDPDGT